jgi:hypothetical protein
MAKSKKTITVEELVNITNSMLRESFDTTPAYRKGLIAILEYSLFNTGNYNGFRYMNEKEVPLNELPGIRLNGNSADKFDNTDETRVQYYFK